MNKKEDLKLRLNSGSSDEDSKRSDSSSEDEDEVIDDETINKRVSDFIKRELPNSILIREFNGNFVYQIPLEGFKAE